MMKNIINILALLLIFNNYTGQEPVFSQFYFNPMYLNPALAGMDNNFRLFVNNKNQWSKVPAQFNTSSISFDTWQNHQKLLLQRNKVEKSLCANLE